MAAIIDTTRHDTTRLDCSQKTDKLNVAYLVIAYEDPLQLKALASELTLTSDIFIHINKLVDIQPFRDALDGIEHSERVTFSPKRYAVHWGGYSIIKATFELLRTALAKKNYDRVILLTGLDYPIKGRDELMKIFAENRNTNYIYASRGEVSSEKLPYLKERYCHDNGLIGRFFNFFRKYVPISFISRRKNDFIEYKGKKYTLYGTTPKWALTGECAAYLLKFYQDNPKFNKMFRYLFSPDDFYAVTVINHSPFRETISSDNIFFIRWLPDNKGAKTLELSDMQVLRESGKFFAKKFHSGISDSLTEALQRQ